MRKAAGACGTVAGASGGTFRRMIGTIRTGTTTRTRPRAPRGRMSRSATCRRGSEATMSIVRFDIRPNFRGETVMLLSVDSDGLKLFEEKLRNLDPSKTEHFSACDQEHTMKIEAEHARIVKQGNSVAWTLTPEKQREII